MKDFSKFEKSSGLRFKNPDLLKEALTHRSYINENKDWKIAHNERLEFLGDAVLELVITRFLFDKYPDKNEGDLTSYRAALVNAQTCSEVASGLSINDYVLLSRGESKDTGRARQYILANALEALIGAIYLDSGYDAARDFILRTIAPYTEKIVSEGLWVDAKSSFQEKAQEHANTTPSYKTIKETGPDHDKGFTVAVFIGSEQVATGDGKSKQDAEQSAAAAALEARGW